MTTVAESDTEDPLNTWLALEIRRVRVAFAGRSEEDERLVSAGHRKGGARVKLVLHWMDKIAVPLADATLRHARQYASSAPAVDRARLRVCAFIQEMGDYAIAMAAFVEDRSAINVAVTEFTRAAISKLREDIDRSFLVLGQDSLAPARQSKQTIQKSAPMTATVRRGARPGPKPRKWAQHVAEIFKNHHDSVTDMSERQRHRFVLTHCTAISGQPGSDRTTTRHWEAHLERRARELR